MKIWPFILLIFSFPVFSQVDLRSFDYSTADSIALSFPRKKKYKTTEELALALTANLTTEQEKFRAIFRWITENVEYSYSNRKEDPKKAMNSKKAVCIGYSTLLKEMCGTVGIDCPVITGAAKNEANDIGKKYNSTHAWNKVNLNGEWYVVDVTWASGYFDDKKHRFTKTFKEHYFLTPPEKFINNHYPENKKDQLLDEPVPYRKYKRTPIKSVNFYPTVEESYGEDGMLKTSAKKPLKISLPLKDQPQNVVIQLDDDYVIQPKITRDEEGNYVLEQLLNKPGKHELKIFVDGKYILSHILKVR